MKIAVVTGGNRGIGFAISKQLHEAGFRVYLTARDKHKAASAAAEIHHEIIPAELDVAERINVETFAAWLKDREKHIDILVNNAGIIGSNAIPGADEEFETVMQTNLFGPVTLTSALLPLLKKSDDARVINISSGMGSRADLELGSYGAYRLSKASLNDYTILIAAALKQTPVKIVCMCPGWVATDMGGMHAPRKVADVANEALWLAESKDVITGRFYRYKKIVQW